MGATNSRGAPVPHNVLVVGGDAQVRSAAVAVIEDAHIGCAEAVSAEDALAYLREHAPDVQLIFTSFELPGRLDGVDVARVAALRWPWIKVLVTSGGARLRDVPSNVIFLPSDWDRADLQAQISWVGITANASESQQQRRTAA
jgi:two-component system, response regulator PdtaR